jgi:hypothetical protein
LQQLPIALNLNSIDKKMMHATWLISRQSFTASGEVGNSPNRARRYRRRVKDDGFKGLRMLPWLWDAAPTDRRYYPLYA